MASGFWSSMYLPLLVQLPVSGCVIVTVQTRGSSWSPTTPDNDRSTPSARLIWLNKYRLLCTVHSRRQVDTVYIWCFCTGIHQGRALQWYVNCTCTQLHYSEAHTDEMAYSVTCEWGLSHDETCDRMRCWYNESCWHHVDDDNNKWTANN